MWHTTMLQLIYFSVRKTVREMYKNRWYRVVPCRCRLLPCYCPNLVNLYFLFSLISCSIGFKTDEPSLGNWRERFHPSVIRACQTSLFADPIQPGNKANECPVQRWKATLEITGEQLPVVNSQSSQTVYWSSTLTSSQSDQLSRQDYRTTVPRTDINHTKLQKIKTVMNWL